MHRRHDPMVLKLLLDDDFGDHIESPRSSTPISKGWQPPLVDRYILEKLDRLSSTDNSLDDWERFLEEGYYDVLSTVPLVQRIPEAAKRISSKVKSNSLSSSHNLRGKRFLLPSWVGEQESKARLHLVQLVELASRLNRTLVLPNISKGRMGTCMKSDFGLYYNARAINGSMPFADFIDLASSSHDTLTGSMLAVSAKAPGKSYSYLDDLTKDGVESLLDVFVDNFGDPSKSKHNSCLKDKLPSLHFRDFSPVWLSVKAPQSAKSRNTGDQVAVELVQAITAPELLKHSSRLSVQSLDAPDVLVVEWDLRYPLFPHIQDAGLSYSKVWKDLAEELSKDIQPYVGIHWRMETITPLLLPACAEQLIRRLEESLKTSTIRNVYFATDYPVADEGRPRSGTFGKVQPDQRSAISKFAAAFTEEGPLSNSTLFRLEDIIRARSVKRISAKVPPFEDWDLGLVGILDKLILINSAFFLSADASCGKYR